jgi:hypothetical protein
MQRVKLIALMGDRVSTPPPSSTRAPTLDDVSTPAGRSVRSKNGSTCSSDSQLLCNVLADALLNMHRLCCVTLGCWSSRRRQPAAAAW